MAVRTTGRVLLMGGSAGQPGPPRRPACAVWSVLLPRLVSLRVSSRRELALKWGVGGEGFTEKNKWMFPIFCPHGLFLDSASLEVRTICKHSLKMVILSCRDLENKFSIVEWMSCRFFSLFLVQHFLISTFISVLWFYLHVTSNRPFDPVLSMKIRIHLWMGKHRVKSASNNKKTIAYNWAGFEICSYKRGWRLIRTLSSGSPQPWVERLSSPPLLPGRAGVAA